MSTRNKIAIAILAAAGIGLAASSGAWAYRGFGHGMGGPGWNGWCPRAQQVVRQGQRLQRGPVTCPRAAGMTGRGLGPRNGTGPRAQLGLCPFAPPAAAGSGVTK